MLKSYVVMCRLYKINHMHMHLTDDGSFTFPSKVRLVIFSARGCISHIVLGGYEKGAL
jgi:hypothetical protein